MKYLYITVATAGLIMSLVPSILHYTGSMPAENMKNWIFIGLFIWFAGAIPWLGKKEQQNN